MLHAACTHGIKKVVECCLCRSWVHSQYGIKCVKYDEQLDLNKMNTNFYCKTCLETLVNYYTSLLNDANIDGMVNFLSSFNIDKVLNDQDDINLCKVAIGNAIDDKVLNRGIYFNQVISSV